MRVEIGAMVAKEAITDRQSADHTQRFQRLQVLSNSRATTG